MKMASHALSPRVQRRTARGSKLAVKCDPVSCVGEGANQTGEEKIGDLKCGITEDSNATNRRRRFNGARVQWVLNNLRQQARLQYMYLLHSSRSKWSREEADLYILERIRARRLKTLFALAEHFDSISSSLETDTLQTFLNEPLPGSPKSGSISQEDAVQLEAKLSHMSIST